MFFDIGVFCRIQPGLPTRYWIQIAVCTLHCKSIITRGSCAARATLSRSSGSCTRRRGRTRCTVRSTGRSRQSGAWKTLISVYRVLYPDNAPIFCTTSKFLPLISVYPDIAIRYRTRNRINASISCQYRVYKDPGILISYTISTVFVRCRINIECT